LIPSILLFIFVFCLLWGLLVSTWVIHQPRFHSSATPSDLGLPWEPLRLTADDKTSISGWLIRKSGAEGVLILLHGFGTSKADLLDVAETFHRQGNYHLILIDFRAHGESSGTILSFGKNEVLDIRAAITYAASDPGMKGLPVGCYGLSMGGVISIFAAAHYPEIRAVVSDSAYSDLGKAIARALRMSYHIPRFFFGQPAIWITQLRLRASASSLSPVRAIAKIAPRPVLIIHGTADRTTPFSDGEELFKAASEPKSIWPVPEAEHVSCFYLDKAAYTRRVMEFFAHGFLGKA
jgi:fermentation-respiration switch protein FrsA (DUF1100 family)